MPNDKFSSKNNHQGVLNMFKRWLTLISLCALTVLTACGGSSAPGGDTNANESSSSNAPTQSFSIGTGTSTGTYFPVGVGIAKAISEGTNYELNAESTGGSIQNLQLLNSGELQLALSASNTAYAAYNGEEPFEQPITKIRAIAALYPEVFQFVVRKDSGIESFEDLAGKKVAMGSPGSGTERTGKLILEAHGLTYDDFKPEFISFSDAVTGLKDKTIDAAIVGAGIPTAAVVDAAASMDIKLLSLDSEKFEAFVASDPYFITTTIPAGTYEGVDEDVVSGASPALLIVSEDLDEQVVYEMTKALFENLNKVKESHAVAQNISLETAVEGVSIPFHPGAAKYYKEQNIDVPTQ